MKLTYTYKLLVRINIHSLGLTVLKLNVVYSLQHDGCSVATNNRRTRTKLTFYQYLLILIGQYISTSPGTAYVSSLHFVHTKHDINPSCK